MKQIAQQHSVDEGKQEVTSEVKEVEKPHEDRDQGSSADADTADLKINVEEAESSTSLDYAASVSSLTLQFLNENEATRISALSWLIMLQQKSPRKVRHKECRFATVTEVL